MSGCDCDLMLTGMRHNPGCPETAVTLETPPAAKSFRAAADLARGIPSDRTWDPEIVNAACDRADVLRTEGGENPLMNVYPTAFNPATGLLEPRAKKRPSFADIYMALAMKLSERSTCSRLQVGCAIVSADSRYVFGVGYNGGASGLENECASLEPGQCGHLHAEENAIINCTAQRSASKVVFVTHLPCVMCAKRLINLGGVTRIHYAHDYRVRDSVDLFTRAGIECGQHM